MLNRRISAKEASDALDAIDDYARMGVGVDAIGPREVLEMFIKQVEEEREELDDSLPYSFDLFYDIKSKKRLYDHLAGVERMATSASDEELLSLMDEHGLERPSNYPKPKVKAGVLTRVRNWLGAIQ